MTIISFWETTVVTAFMFFISEFREFSEVVDIEYKKVFTLFAKGNIFMININKHWNVIAVQKDKCISFNLF